MRHHLRPALAALATLLVLPPAAGADVVLAADPTAANVSVLGDVAAWSRRGDDGRYRLVVRVGAELSDAPITSSPHPLDPDVGTDADGGTAIVYSRCIRPPRRGGCDVFRYDVDARVEARWAGVATARTSEVAPSLRRGALAFVRVGGPGRRGVHLLRPGVGLRRLATHEAVETDVRETRVVYAVRTRRDSEVRMVDRSGRGNVLLTRATRGAGGDGELLTSPQLGRYHVYWLRRAPRLGTAVVQRVGKTSNRDPRRADADRVLPGATSLAVDRLPELYTGAGVVELVPRLAFAAPAPPP